jgi:glutamate-1-semialdehyde 2,1-aminomutase
MNSKASSEPTAAQKGVGRPLSQAAFARAKRLMPGGVNSPARAFGGVGGEPIFFKRADGAYLFDIDGNRYIDYIGSWGAMILGHNHPRVREAIVEAAARGTSFGAPTEAESQLAELVMASVPSVEQLRLVNSGTEATMSAIRLARGYTDRDLIVKFAGNYHGHADSLLVAAGSSAATLGVPNSAGVTRGTAQDTLVLPYNDPGALEEAFDRHRGQIAGVIFEPIVGNMGCVIPSQEFLQSLVRLTKRDNALLICDEVMTGFRVALGGAQSLWELSPDLSTFGKIIGGGLPLAAYGGRAEIMEHVLPEGNVFQAGTLSGNPLATAAGIATLGALREDPPYARLEQLSATLAAGLGAAATAAGIPHSVTRVGSMMTLFFNPEPVGDWESASRSDVQAFARYFWQLIERGVYMPCSQFEALFVSAAHSMADIEVTTSAAQSAFFWH